MTSTTATADVLVIGAGMAGASVAAELAAGGRKVILLEREEQPGYHTTGRSAAMFIPTYGPPEVRRLSVAGRAWFDNPPDGLAEHRLLSPCGVLWLAAPGEEKKIAQMQADAATTGARLEALAPAEAAKVVPILRPERIAAALLEPDAMSMDVGAILLARLKQIRRAGSRIEQKAEVVGLARKGDIWQTTTADGRRFEAPIVVNAAGAWADVIGRLAGVRGIGLVPKRRTIVTVDPPAGVDVARWPVTGDLAHTFYFKAEAGKLWVSPADETPVEPQDVQPEEMDIAITIERFMAATTVGVGRPGKCWAGLRSFVPDGELVIGFAPDAEGFFWLAGQGGYGIQTSAGASVLAASLIEGRALPAALAEHGVTAAASSPARLAAKS